MEVNFKLHNPVALSPGKISTLPILGVPVHIGVGLDAMVSKIIHHTSVGNGI
jgi:hypothetical protein